MKRGYTRVAVFLIYTMAFTFASATYAQIVGASIKGTVRDTSGASIPLVTILVRNLETGAERKVETDAEGHYAMPSVPVGSYEVSSKRRIQHAIAQRHQPGDWSERSCRSIACSWRSA